MEHFWKKKSLAEFSEQEWESVCMHCGKCCAEKSVSGGKILFFNSVCDGLNLKTGLCNRYSKRLCAACSKVDMKLLREEPELLPESCAYRLLLDGKDLPEWHPLISGDPNSVRKAKQTILDYPNIYSRKDVDDALDEISEKCDAENWGVERFSKEIDVIIQKFPLEPIIIQDIPLYKEDLLQKDVRVF